MNAVGDACDARPFRYTLDDPRLTFEQRKFYENNGYLVLRKLVDEELLDECARRFAELCAGRAPRGGLVLTRDVSLAMQAGSASAAGERLYDRLQDFIWDDVLSRYILAPAVLDVVECFTGPDVTAVHTVLVNQPPDSSCRCSSRPRHPLRQDLHRFPFRPEDRIVGAWTAMEDIQENCLFAVPGSHCAGRLYQHDHPDWEGDVNKAFNGVRGFGDLPRKMLTLTKGDTVFFHPLLLHGCGANLTNGFRKSISAHFAASACYCVDVRGTVQEGIAREVEETEAMRNIRISFQDAWRIRSRCVRGREATASLKPALHSALRSRY